MKDILYMPTNLTNSQKILEEVITNSWSGIGIIDIFSKFVYS